VIIKVGDFNILNSKKRMNAYKIIIYTILVFLITLLVGCNLYYTSVKKQKKEQNSAIAFKIFELAIEGRETKNANKFIEAIKILLKNDQIIPIAEPEVNKNLSFQTFDFLNIEQLYKYAKSYAKDISTKKKLQKLKIKIDAELEKRKDDYKKMGDDGDCGQVQGELYTVNSGGNVPVKLNLETGQRINFDVRVGDVFNIKMTSPTQATVSLSTTTIGNVKSYSFKASTTGKYLLNIKNTLPKREDCEFVYQKICK
jgi:hypothetical protein